MLIKLSLVVISLILSLLAAEFYLDLIDYQPIEFSRQGHIDMVNNKVLSLNFDKDLIFSPQVHPESTNIVFDNKGFRINSNHSNFSYAEKTILMVGDSFTFGTGVHSKSAYPTVLEKLLESSDQSIIVHNAGIPGYGSDQTYYYLTERLLKKIQPDIVIWNLNLNDLIDNKSADLYAIKNDQLIKHNIFFNHLSLKLRFDTNPSFPKVVKQSNLYNIFLNALKQVQTKEKSITSNSQYAKLQQQKLKLQCNQLIKMGKQQDFDVIFVLVPNLAALKQTSDDKFQISYQLMNQVLSLYPNYIDTNKILANNQAPSELTKNNSTVLGKSTLSDFSSIFLDHEKEPKAGEDYRHLNEQGNFLLAEIISHYAQPLINIPSNSNNNQQ